MKTHSLQLILCFLLLFGCKEYQQGTTVEKAEIFFRSLTAEQSGIHFSNNLFHTGDLNIIEYLYYYNGGGVAVGDINNDGLDDIYFSANQTVDRLYLNQGGLKFKDISLEAGIQQDSTWSTGVTMADVNHDGLLDIYVCKVGDYKSLRGHNLLYINQDGESFKEMSREYGLDFSGFSTQGVFFDYDKDGDLDFYLMNHSIHTPRSYGTIAAREQKDSLSGDRMFENQIAQGKKAFTDVTKASGIYSSALGYGLALGVSDINNDGHIDIYVGNDFHENDYLYINQGNKTFKESSADYLNHTSRFTMGLDIADLNADAKPDIFSLDMMPFDKEIFLKSAGEDSDKVAQIKSNYGFNDQYARNVMQLNRDYNSFYDVALMTNTYATDWSWSALIQDFDNDGQNDIFVTNGIYKRPNDLNYINLLSDSNMAEYNKDQSDEIEKELIDEMPTVKIPNVIFRKKGEMQYTMLTKNAGMEPTYSNGAAYSDLDNDGDLDLVISNINQKAQVLENTASENNNHYVSISLKTGGTQQLTSGSKVTVFTDAAPNFKEQATVRGFQSSSTQKIHFGLGKHTTIDSVHIRWPDNTVQKITEIAIDQHHIIEKDAVFTVLDTKNRKGTASVNNFPFVHLENNYLDYEREPLMPEKLSTEGPALLVADFNADGIDDVYMGGAKYQAPSYFIGQADGTFIKEKESGFGKDAIYEDVDAAALDIDNDGDLDIYVVSGGNEIAEGSDYNEDRVYINDGSGKFIRLPLDMLKTNGSTVSSADVNNDGYDDLFVGGRSIPGGYGLSPYSFIFLNNGDGQFNIALKERMGMVTDSQWADMDGDDLLDLIVVGDWMPIKIYLNKGDGNFEQATKLFGLEHTSGLWNSVSVADLDGNGAMDIVAGNTGKNLKWKASKERPVHLYIDDFDGNKQPDPIIFYDFFGKYIPFSSKDMLVGQLPRLKKQFLDYGKFSKIEDIEDLVGLEPEKIMETKKLTELRSMAYFQKDGQFNGQPLPNEAQISVVQDIYVDLDIKKLFFVGNHLDFVNEMGQSDANPGGVIKIGDHGKLSFVNFLALPEDFNGRRITKTSSHNTFLAVGNNGRSYQFKF